mmetsp:Transcript_104155/g.222547  ORF Transcript_104155/g.222547 Transcript_104155/m.222547 type:complete len:220 (+) Transcript_104155:2480-3139(+)
MEAEHELVLLFEPEDLLASDLVARVQGPDSMEHSRGAALLLQVGCDLDHGALVCRREALTSGVEAFDVEGEDAQGRDLDDVYMLNLLVAHIHLYLASADEILSASHVLLQGHPATAYEVSVHHEAQGEGDVRLVRRGGCERPAVGQSKASLDETTACSHKARHCHNDLEEGAVAVSPLEAHERGALDDLYGEYVGLDLISASRLLELCLQGLPEDFDIP